MEPKDKKEYELGYLVGNEGDAAAVIDAVRALGADVREERPASRTRLAYAIDKQEEAFFGTILFAAEPAKAKELEDVLRMDKRVMRSLIVTPPTLKEKRREPQGDMPHEREPRPSRVVEARPAPLSNEALEKKIEEILQ